MSTATQNEIVIPPVVNEHEIPVGTKCQEASRMSSNRYIPCSAPASSIVFAKKDRRSYYMCDVCASHAVKNRGCELRYATETIANAEPKTELVKQPSPFSAPIKFEVSMEQIKQLAAEYMPLAIVDVNDKAQLEKVHTARMDVVRLIRGIEKGGKEMRDEANKFAKNVIAAERTFTDPLVKIRDHLANEEDKVKREAALVATRALAARQAKTRERLQKLQGVGKSYLADDIADLPDDEFEQLYEAELADWRRRDAEAKADAAERERIAAEQKAEADRLEKVAAELEAKRVAAETRNKRAMARMQLLANAGYAHTLTGDELADMPAPSWESLLDGARKEKAARDKAAADQQAALDKQRAEQEEEREKINAEKNRLRNELCQKRLETVLEIGIPFGHLINTTTCGDGKTVGDMPQSQFDEIVAKLQAERKETDAELEREKQEAAEQARLDAIAEQERVAAAEKAHAEAAAAEQQQQEELRPDREKIAIFADSIGGMLAPRLSPKAKEASTDIGKALLNCAMAIRAAGSKLK